MTRADLRDLRRVVHGATGIDGRLRCGPVGFAHWFLLRTHGKNGRAWVGRPVGGGDAGQVHADVLAVAARAALLGDGSAGNLAELDRRAGHDAVGCEGELVVAGRRLGDAERHVRAVVTVLEGDAPPGRHADQDGLAVLPDAELRGVLHAHEPDARRLGHVERTAANSSVPAAVWMTSPQHEQADVQFALRLVAHLDGITVKRDVEVATGRPFHRP